ncbi:flagellar motor switch protein FliM [Parasporobacterium paucivorans]|uniref:Flagellar motor switch protein FliM n=1 Tax=Parasporobacterium paucivorans DSM 15970 TaxID=1122934 RepID=A0A1M6I8Q1_9FIRM|nr:FliM/FliN family flagellar motor switch protein [Parasporobacterium paucivorans]SHJ30869.1 flagellar motor switch protein FliM [Parasporobacterium paucivorans DSM 15970]
MADVLSQSQIDALLNSLSGGNASDQAAEDENKGQNNFKKYDFTSPKKFTKDKLKILKNVYENYARIASSQINSLFRVSSEAEVIAVEEQRYYEFTNALSENDFMTLASVTLPYRTKNPPVLIHVSTPVMIYLMDRMLGSSGAPEIVPDGYSYTEIEQALYEKIIHYLIAIMTDAWTGYIKMGIHFDRIQKNPGLVQEIGVDETVVIIVLEMKMERISGKFSICVPGSLLTGVFAAMDKRKHISQEEGSEDVEIREEILNNIKNSKLEVTAQLGTAQLKLEDIYKLNVGDVINLNKPKDSQIQLSVAGKPWFNGQLGVYNRNVAVRLEDRLEEEKI